MDNKKIHVIQAVLLLATAFVIAFVAYAIYQHGFEEIEEEQSLIGEEQEADPADDNAIESIEDLDAAVEELETLEIDDDLELEEFDESLEGGHQG